MGPALLSSLKLKNISKLSIDLRQLSKLRLRTYKKKKSNKSNGNCTPFIGLRQLKSSGNVDFSKNNLVLGVFPDSQLSFKVKMKAKIRDIQAKNRPKSPCLLSMTYIESVEVRCILTIKGERRGV